MASILRRFSRQTKHSSTKSVKSGWEELKTLDGVAYYYNHDTKEISFDKPDRLRSETEVARTAGDWYWVPHPTKVWQPARRLEGPAGEDRSAPTVLETQDGAKITIPASGVVLDPTTNGREQVVEFWPVSMSTLPFIEEDLVLLEDVNPGIIIHNLRERYAKNDLYTWVGAAQSVLVSVNPYQNLPLYGEDQIELHRNKTINQEVPPHVFDIANNSLDSMLFDMQDQSILISGESGAGKTEATKQCLKFLAHVAGSVGNVEQKLLQANPVLESFGNAKTIRNNNSSRFGKWMEVYFDQLKGNIGSARIINYLLEKSRLVHQQRAERNFHIFYQMTSAADKAKWELSGPEHYRYLNQSHTEHVEGIDAAADFAATYQAMKDLEFSSEEEEWVLRLAAFVLHLGNCTFAPKALDGNVAGSSIESDEPLGKAAKFLSVDPEPLRKVLLNRSITVRNETSVIPLDPEKARAGCDSLAKGVYGRLFDWLVRRVNKSLEGDASGHFIGILDIFGFEIFDNNSFEQLCINYANEKLQQLFNRSTFKEEEALYESEGINFQHVEFIDNQVVLDLIERKPDGVLPLLDDECIMPEGNDDKFMSKMEQAHLLNDKFMTDKHRKLNNSLSFEIKHYAGIVCYDASAFMDKNKDTFYADCYELCASSKDPLTKELFPATGARVQIKSLSTVFRAQLGELMDKLYKTRTRYIRCVKPNNHMSPSEFDSVLVIQQLMYSGVFEAVKIRKQGYPFRWTYKGFATRYRCINPDYRYAAPDSDPQAVCKEILDVSPQSFPDVQFGKTMVLFRAHEHRLLKLLRNLSIEILVPRLQRCIRGFLPREMKRRLLKSEKAIRDALEVQNDHAVLKAALENIEPTIGNMRKLFPGYLPRNKDEGEAHLVLLAKWLDMEKELEAIVQEDPNKVYRKLWDITERAEALMHIPRSAKQQELFDKAKKSIAECDLGQIDNEATELVRMPKADRERMKALLEKAQKFEHTSAVLDQIKAVVDELDSVDREAEEALKYVDRVRMEAVIKLGEKYQYTASDSAVLAEIARLLKAPEKEFVEAELTVAERDGDDKRAVHRKIRLRQLFLAANASSFERLDRYAELRTPDEFAKSKMFGKAKLREGMLKWSKAPIPTSLTRSDDPAFKKEAVLQNKNLLAYCGDKKPGPEGADSAGSAFVGAAQRGDDALKIELMLQLYKHITENPSAESITKAYEVLGVSLMGFPLPEDFENSLATWIAQSAGANTQRLLSAMNVGRYGAVPVGRDMTMSVRAYRELENGGSRFSISQGEPSGPSKGR